VQSAWRLPVYSHRATYTARQLTILLIIAKHQRLRHLAERAPTQSAKQREKPRRSILYKFNLSLSWSTGIKRRSDTQDMDRPQPTATTVTPNVMFDEYPSHGSSSYRHTPLLNAAEVGPVSLLMGPVCESQSSTARGSWFANIGDLTWGQDKERAGNGTDDGTPDAASSVVNQVCQLASQVLSCLATSFAAGCIPTQGQCQGQ
jgi:hypothetical protein